jgi:hypothetical protein
MEVVDYYYKLLEIPKDSSKEDIYNAYKIKIEKYRNLPFLNTAQKNEIKDLKKAKFVLSNEELKNKYDSIIEKQNIESHKMKEWERTTSKKEKVNSQLVSDRVFQMAGILNIPQKNLDIDRTFFKSTLSRKEQNETKNNRFSDEINRVESKGLNDRFDEMFYNRNNIQADDKMKKDKELINEIKSINYDSDNFETI